MKAWIMIHTLLALLYIEVMMIKCYAVIDKVTYT